MKTLVIAIAMFAMMVSGAMAFGVEYGQVGIGGSESVTIIGSVNGIGAGLSTASVCSNATVNGAANISGNASTTASFLALQPHSVTTYVNTTGGAGYHGTKTFFKF